MFKRLKNWIRDRFFIDDDLAIVKFFRLGFTLYEDYGHKIVYMKDYKDLGYTHFIEIRINLVNEVHIMSYDQNMMAVQLYLDELDAALVQVHELIMRRKESDAKYDTRAK